MPQSTAAKVDADADPALFVLEQVHVVIATPDRAKLLARLLLQLANLFNISPGWVVEERVVSNLAARPADAEDNGAGNVVHHLLDIRTQIDSTNVSTGGFIAARDIVAHPAGRDRTAIGHNTADRH